MRPTALSAMACEAAVENRIAGRRDFDNYEKARSMTDEMKQDKKSPEVKDDLGPKRKRKENVRQASSKSSQSPCAQLLRRSALTPKAKATSSCGRRMAGCSVEASCDGQGAKHKGPVQSPRLNGSK